MSATNSKNSKATKATKTETTPVVAAAPAPVAAAPASQKGGKATKAEAAPAPTPAPVEKQKGGKTTKTEAAPVKTTTPAPVEKQKAGAKKVAAKSGKAATAKKGGAKKTAEKAPKAKQAKKEASEEEEDGAKGVRSFKVQLPGSAEYTGRFTGLTPYQAANKALSKYFRENKTAKSEITFSIRESTRGSKRSTYTYNGKREKLTTPVKYSIKSADGVAREIVKEYKNRLTKVKKSETKEATA